MQKLFFILIGVLFLNNVHAQKYFKPSGYAFSILIQPGTIQVDENGMPLKRKINRERFIYIVTSGKTKPFVSAILYGKTAVKWDVVGLAEKEFSAIRETTQKAIVIKPPKGNSMWRINIQEISNHSISEKGLPIIIKGNNANQPFSILLNNETALQGFDRY